MADSSQSDPFLQRNKDILKPAGGALLDVSVDAGNMIHLRMGGDLSSDNLAEFTAWAEKFKKVMAETAAKAPGRVLTIIDARGMGQFDMATSKVVFDLMNFNRAYATRTAVFGFDTLAELAFDGIVAMAHRDNLKAFKTEEEALAWLREGIQK